MDRTPVTSSNIAEVGYDESSNTLEIQFNDQSVYQYIDVPKTVFESLVSAASVGQYFHANIRGQFRYSKI